MPDPTPIQGLDPVSFAREFLDPVLFQRLVRLAEGFQSPEFIRGFLGSGAGLFEEDGRWKLEAHDLTIRGALRVFELLVSKVRVSIGTQIISNGGGKVESVEPLGGGLFRLRFESDDGLAPVSEGDLLQAQRRSRPKGTSQTGFGVYLSRLTVISMDAGATYADCRLDQGSAAPEPGFEYAQMGNETNPSRQGLVAITAEEEGPSVLVRDNVDSWPALDSQATLRAVYGRLNVLGVFAGGEDVYGLAAGDFAGGWTSLTGGGVTFWTGTDQVGYVQGRAIRIGNDTSHFLFDADTGKAEWVVGGAGMGSRLLLSAREDGSLAEIELATGAETGSRIRIGADQLLIEALRTVFGSPGVLTDPTQDAGAWRLPQAGPGLGVKAVVEVQGGGVAFEGSAETREAVRWARGEGATLSLSVVGTIAADSDLAVEVAWLDAAGQLLVLETVIDRQNQSQAVEPLSLVAPAVAPAGAAAYRVRVVTAEYTIPGQSVITALTAEPVIEAGLLGATIIDNNGNIRTDRIDVQAVVNAARVVAKELEAATGDITLLRVGDWITLDGRTGRIIVTDSQGRETSIGAFDFGDVISGSVSTAPAVSASEGLSVAQANPGASDPDDVYDQAHTAQATEGRSYQVLGSVEATAYSEGEGATASAESSVAAWYEVGGAEVAGSRLTAQVGVLGGGSDQTDADLQLGPAPAGATLRVRVNRVARASVAAGQGPAFQYAESSAATGGLQVLVDGVSGQFFGPAGVAYVDDDGSEAYVKRAGGEVGMERLVYRGNEYHDNGDGILRRV